MRQVEQQQNRDAQLLDQLREQTLDLKGKLGHSEQQLTIMKSGKDLLERELQQMRNQNSQFNHQFQTQHNLGGGNTNQFADQWQQEQ